MLRPEVLYAPTDDGRLIAYTALGEGPITVTLLSPMVSQLEVAFEEPAFEHFVARLATCARVLLFDRRGTGLSDRSRMPPDGSLSRLARDIVAVLDASHTESTVLFGITLGCQVALQFAVAHPDRTNALVLVGGFAKLTRLGEFDFTADPGQVEAWADRTATLWGTGAVVGAHAPLMLGNVRYQDWAARLERHTCSPSEAADLCRWVAGNDVRPILGQVRTPTLVVHRAGDRSLPVTDGRLLAEAIPGATYLELPGDTHTFFLGDQRETIDGVIGFLDRTVTAGSLRAALRRADRKRAAGHGWRSLTPSEQEVTRLVASGLTNNEVASRLGMSPHTVDGRLRRVFGKLGVNTRVELTAEYARVAD